MYADCTVQPAVQKGRVAKILFQPFFLPSWWAFCAMIDLARFHEASLSDRVFFLFTYVLADTGIAKDKKL